MKEEKDELLNEILKELNIDECVYPFTLFRVKEACKTAIRKTRQKTNQEWIDRIDKIINNYKGLAGLGSIIEELEKLKDSTDIKPLKRR